VKRLLRLYDDKSASPALTSAGVPSPGVEDHVRGEGQEIIAYLDLACPHCAVTWGQLGGLGLRVVFRHFPVASKHPRAPALHAAAEAVAVQGSEEVFWRFVDSIYGDQGRVDDPHLWERARALGLDLERFEADRRSTTVADRVRRDFDGGIRAGVVGTPAAFLGGRQISGDLASNLAL
jgi:protein-disulfide isomerase